MEKQDTISQQEPIYKFFSGVKKFGDICFRAVQFIYFMLLGLAILVGYLYVYNNQYWGLVNIYYVLIKLLIFLAVISLVVLFYYLAITTIYAKRKPILEKKRKEFKETLKKEIIKEIRNGRSRKG